ncbi:MAG TPA: hypothetical protein VFN65_08305 [Solirubrobacteraceae bacterium]|nr:hypothetical protein [Solirubrobacteraceae bacterium]
MLKRTASLLTAGALASGVTACGSVGPHGSGGPAASGDPSALLRQTFAASHSVRSGILDLRLVITPRGSAAMTTPLSLSLRGPFQSRGSGHPAESALTVTFSAAGRHGSLGVTTTASGAYVTLGGTSFALPQAEFRKLESSLGARTGSGATPGLSSLGVNPEQWVVRPRFVGTATIDGALTEHLHAGVDVRAFALSLGKVLARESSTLRAAGGAAVPTHITSAQASKIAAAIRRPTVDVYTGRSDSTLRRLTLDMTLPVHGSLAARLGGLSSAAVRLTVDYSHLNEPQTISAPPHPQSFRSLQSRLQALGGGIAAGGLGSTGIGASRQVSKYATCIQKANGQVAKMQKCAALLQNAG